ncbi:hypothetical protein AYL99_11376 [Fonsecaea erecta]|uniref:Transcription factor domain-containing protein n=1 Tax=Fonsecaea erecta TaxID=1367422 RepID=A0A178Z5C4_9EURO|nr:hypothetical protein AYL99_11376 [Fonsecaea erecta]OAP54275.1 hypothetical protein AYL99_11376 [Fonsecaea erecta]
MGIRKLNVDDWIIYDNLFLDEHRRKFERLQDPEVRPVIFQCQDGTYEASKEALAIIVQYITTRYPDMFQVDGDYLQIPSLGESYRIREPFDRHPLEIAGLIVYEDVYVLQKGPDDIYYLKACFLSFPPGWHLRDRIGYPLFKMHQAVPHWKEKLQKPMERFFLKLKEGGGVQRNNQFIQTTPAIYHPAPLDDYPVCTSIDQVHIRIELQSLMRMPETQALLFTIHPWVLPVKELAHEPGNLEKLWSHARSFPDSFSRYKLRHLWGGVLDEFARQTLGKEVPDPELEAEADAFTLRQPSRETDEDDSDVFDATWTSLPTSTRTRSPVKASPPTDKTLQISPVERDDSVNSALVSRSENRSLALQVHGPIIGRRASISKSTTSLHLSLLADSGRSKTDTAGELPASLTKPLPPMPSPPVPYLIQGIETALEHELFHHYINFVPQAFSWATIRSAPFLSILIPLVLRDRGLLYTLLSIAATHLLNLGHAQMSETRQRAIKSTRWQLRGKALKCHAEKMAAVSVPAFSNDSVQVKLDAALASTLLLLQLDCLDSGKDGHWRLHLFAASELARQRVKEGWSDKDADGAPTNSRDETAVRFFLHLYRYYDVLACVTLDERPCPIDPVYSSEDIGSYSPLPQTYHSLLSILTQIVELRRRTQPELSLGQTTSTTNRNLADVNMEEFMKSLELCTRIQNWTIRSDSQEDLILGEVYRRACFIFLYLTTYPSGVADAKVQCALEEGLAHLELLASHEMALKCATFPLFIFGIAALQPDQQDMISKVLDLRFHQSGIGNVAEVLVFLKEWWIREYDESNRSFWLWEDEIRTRQMYLFLV